MRKTFIGAEITSVLQITFLVSLLEKLGLTPSKIGTLYLDLYILNPGVNDSLIAALRSTFHSFGYHCADIIDLRFSAEKIPRGRKYDVFVLRSRLDYRVHDKYTFRRDYFYTVGNVAVTAELLKNINVDLICSVDDGLSNWNRNLETKFNCNFIRRYFADSVFKIAYHRRLIPLTINKAKKVNHYSIFSSRKKNNIAIEFNSTLSGARIEIPSLDHIKNIFIGCWPELDRAISTDNSDAQLVELFGYLQKSKININEIYVRQHPKYRIPLPGKTEIQLINFPEELGQVSLEILFQKMPNLTNIFSFPTTTAYLLHRGIIKIKSNPMLHLLKTGNADFYTKNESLFDYEKCIDCR